MTELTGNPPPTGADDYDDAISLQNVWRVLRRQAWVIVALIMGGGALGMVSGLSEKPYYVSSATFIPRGAEGGASGLALAASQFGISVPSTGGTWGAPIYLEVLRSQAVLEPIARSSVVLPQEGGRRVAIVELLGVGGESPARRIDLAVRQLRATTNATQDAKIGAVRLSVTTPWPTVSLWLAEELVRGVNRFNSETRKSQAAEERRFVEEQSLEAERTLRRAEDRLQAFLQQNRDLGSAELVMQRERLAREVILRQQVYTSLVQNREEARIREVRDTPVITVLESPRLPLDPEPRGPVRKTILGALLGAMFGLLLAFGKNHLESSRSLRGPAAAR